MNVYGEFFLKFMEPFFGGLINLVKELGSTLFQIFNILNYVDVIREYISELSGAGIVIIILAALCLLLIFGLFFFFIYKMISKYIRYRHKVRHQDSLVDEIDSLNNEVIKLKSANERFVNMRDSANDTLDE